MRQVHAYDLATGLLTGQAFVSNDPAHPFVPPAGCGFVEGVTVWRAQKVDLATGLLVDYQPPASRADEKQQALSKITAQIEAIEATQARALREVTLALAAGTTPAADTVNRLRAADAQIAQLRNAIT